MPKMQQFFFLLLIDILPFKFGKKKTLYFQSWPTKKELVRFGKICTNVLTLAPGCILKSSNLQITGWCHPLSWLHCILSIWSLKLWPKVRLSKSGLLVIVEGSPNSILRSSLKKKIDFYHYLIFKNHVNICVTDFMLSRNLFSVLPNFSIYLATLALLESENAVENVNNKMAFSLTNIKKRLLERLFGL